MSHLNQIYLRLDYPIHPFTIPIIPFITKLLIQYLQIIINYIFVALFNIIRLVTMKFKQYHSTTINYVILPIRTIKSLPQKWIFIYLLYFQRKVRRFRSNAQHLFRGRVAWGVHLFVSAKYESSWRLGKWEKAINKMFFLNNFLKIRHIFFNKEWKRRDVYDLNNLE